MRVETNTASVLSLIAPLFSYLNEEDYGQVMQSGAWQETAPALPSWQKRSSFQNELLVPGMPLAAMPVESLYKPWSSCADNAFGAARGLYLGDPARHLSTVYRDLAIDVPAAFSSMPDHLTLELELLALFLEAGNEEAARQLAADHLDWLDGYDAALAERAERVAQCRDMAPERRAALEEGIAFLRALVGTADRVARAHAERRTRPLRSG